VAHPQIAAFVRLAKENTKPSRVIAGQETLLSRTMHGIAYDAANDEILVPNPFAQSILAFKGDVTGEKKPLRVIQGPHTQMMKPDQVDVDPEHNEIFVPDASGILVFQRDGNGDVAPLRRIYSANWQADGVTVDPVHNVLVAPGKFSSGNSRSSSALMIFNRTDNGDVQPKAVIGPQSLGANSIFHRCMTQPQGGWIICSTRALIGQGQEEQRGGFIGVWSINDSGNVPPRWKIVGSKTQMQRPMEIAINPTNREIMISDMGLNAVLTYYFPEIF
jgi:hypothetical protein